MEEKEKKQPTEKSTKVQKKKSYSEFLAKRLMAEEEIDEEVEEEMGKAISIKRGIRNLPQKDLTKEQKEKIDARILSKLKESFGNLPKEILQRLSPKKIKKVGTKKKEEEE